MSHWSRRARARRAAISLLLALPIASLALPAAALQEAPAVAGGPEVQPRISLTLRDTPLRSALELLFQQTGMQHAVESAVPNVPVTLNLRDASFATALRVITRLAGVTYRREGDVYVIGVRRPVEPAVTEVEPPVEAVVPSEPTWEKIPIQYNHVAVFGYGLGGTLLPSEVDVMGGGAGGFGGGFGGGLGGFGGGVGGFGGNTFGGGFGGFNNGFGGGFGGLNSGFGGFGGLNNAGGSGAAVRTPGFRSRSGRF